MATAHRPLPAGSGFEPMRRRDRLAVHDQATALFTGLMAAWLFLGAWALGYADSSAAGGDAYLNESVVGVLLVFFALARFFRPLQQRFASVATMLLGAWLIVSPFIWDYGDRPNKAQRAPELEWGTGAVLLLLGALGLLWTLSARRLDRSP
ncbi:hypothetical protein [Streptomyces sp. TR06-5]|uniref:SPW repeat domain-containing protein n=1 Tax=unclassified Streptomyces TaxID=2593676 RepID=UPI0039A020B5